MNETTTARACFSTREIADSLGEKVGNVRSVAFRLFPRGEIEIKDDEFVFSVEQTAKIEAVFRKENARKSNVLAVPEAKDSAVSADSENTETTIKDELIQSRNQPIVFSSFTNNNGIQTVSARELHEKLESAERFSKWWERFVSYGFKENEDFTRVQKSTVVNNGALKEIGDYTITIEMAKQICMLQRTENGKRYREYFIQIEKAWNTPEAIMARALQVANRTIEDTKKLLAVMTPKADYYDKICDATNLTEIGTVGKNISIGSQKFFKRLVDDKVIRKRFVDGVDYYEAYYDYEKYFQSVPVPFVKDGKNCTRNKLMFNADGVAWATRRYRIKGAA